MNRTLLAPVIAAAAAITLAGCSSSGSTGSAPTSSGSMSMPMSSGSTSQAAGQHNQADVTFATDMIPHHQQAVQMADMAATKATNAQVKSLAAAIKNAQDPEISSMTEWLTSWNAPVPTSSMSGMSMGRMNTGNGMMSDTEMANLTKTTGAAFDHLWVTMMITHHKGAVAMANTELATGQYPQAKALAQSISDSQAKEITSMRRILSRLG